MPPRRASKPKKQTPKGPRQLTFPEMSRSAFHQRWTHTRQGAYLKRYGNQLSEMMRFFVRVGLFKEALQDAKKRNIMIDQLERKRSRSHYINVPSPRRSDEEMYRSWLTSVQNELIQKWKYSPEKAERAIRSSRPIEADFLDNIEKRKTEFSAKSEEHLSLIKRWEMESKGNSPLTKNPRTPIEQAAFLAYQIMEKTLAEKGKK